MNKVMLIGNVGVEPDVRYYDRDQAVAQVSLATTERGYMLQNGTQVPDHTDWHHLLFYRGLAKVVEKYVHKGDRLYVEGRIRYRSYNDKEGRRHFVTEILVENMEMLSSKESTVSVHTDAKLPQGDQSSSSFNSPSSTDGDADKSALPF